LCGGGEEELAIGSVDQVPFTKADYARLSTTAALDFIICNLAAKIPKTDPVQRKTGINEYECPLNNKKEFTETTIATKAHETILTEASEITFKAIQVARK
jgi:hypothetical protein